METESLGTLLQSNLAALGPLTRRVLEAASPDGVVQIHTAGGVMSASLRVPDGRVDIESTAAVIPSLKPTGSSKARWAASPAAYRPSSSSSGQVSAT